MSTLPKVSRALRTSFGLSLVAALAFVNGCSAGEDTDEPRTSDAPSTGEAADELLRSLPAGIYECSLAGGLITGTLVAYPGPWRRTTCAIFAPKLPGASQFYCSRPRNSGVLLCSDCRELHDHFECPYR